MATSVLLHVTASQEVDHVHSSEQPPAAVLRLLQGAGQSTAYGMSKREGHPWRWRFYLTGSDKVTVGRALETQLRALGFKADVTFMP